MFGVDDAINAGVGIFGKIWEARKIQQEVDKWLKFWSGQVFTYWITLNVVLGGTLILTKNLILVGLGTGMLAASARCIWAWRQAKDLTKDIVIAVPNDTYIQGDAGSKIIDNTVTLGLKK